MKKEMMPIIGMIAILVMVSSACADAIIIDHTCTDLSEIPDEWIEKARDDFEIFYAHTSHGSQIVTGVTMWASANSTLYTTPGFYEVSDDLGHNGDVSWVSPTKNLVRKTLKNSGGSHSSENYFFIDSISTAIARSCMFFR